MASRSTSANRGLPKSMSRSCKMRIAVVRPASEFAAIIRIHGRSASDASAGDRSPSHCRRHSTHLGDRRSIDGDAARRQRTSAGPLLDDHFSPGWRESDTMVLGRRTTATHPNYGESVVRERVPSRVRALLDRSVAPSNRHKPSSVFIGVSTGRRVMTALTACAKRTKRLRGGSQ